MATVLITGGAGMLGSALIRRAPRTFQLHATQRHAPAPSGCTAHTLDLADRTAVVDLWDRVRPDTVIHTAYTMGAGERDIWQATRNVVDATSASGARLIHMSTDLVLDGESAPYAEDALPAPVHDYGRWKARAEEYVRERRPDAAVIRTSLITSFEPLDPRSAWVAAGLRGEQPLTLFTDEIRCPIVVDDLVAQIWEIAELPSDEAAGVWHLAGPEALSRYAIGLLVAARLGLPAGGIVPASSSGASERRPRDLRLLTSRAARQLRTRPRTLSALLLEGRLAESPARE